MTEQTKKTDGSEKKSFTVFDVFLLLVAALVLSLAVYLLLETPYGIHEEPAYRVTMRGTLADWEEDLVPAERQRVLDESGAPAGRILSVAVVNYGGEKVLHVSCEWEGEKPRGEEFRLETVDFVKNMVITSVTETGQEGL